MMNMKSHSAGMLRGAKPAPILPPPPHSGAKPAPLAGRYQIEAPLGHDAGSVFRARDLKTGSRHAVKWLPREASLQAGEYERLVSEVTQLSQLCHPNIVTMTALHRDASGRPFLVMELLEGEDALTHLAGGQRLPLPRVLEITHQVASALHCAHLCGIAHRDFQLSSIFLALHKGLSGERAEVVKVVGFGAAKLPGRPSRFVQDSVIGRAEYLAPEGTLGCRSELDARSDQWAVAVAVYRMLSGRLPFTADNEAELHNQICTLPPPSLDALCPELPQHVMKTLCRALSKDGAQRFASMLDFMQALSGQTQTPLAREAAKRPTESMSIGSASRSVAPPRHCHLSSNARPPQVSRMLQPGSISISEFPTIAMKVDLERTLPMERAVLAQLCADSQASERQRLRPAGLEYPVHVKQPTDETNPAAIPLPALPAPHSRRPSVRRSRWREVLAIILGACIGVCLATGIAWMLDHRLEHPRPSQVTIAVPRVPYRQTAVIPIDPSPQSEGWQSAPSLRPTKAPVGTPAVPELAPKTLAPIGKTRTAPRPPAAGRKLLPTLIRSLDHSTTPSPAAEPIGDTEALPVTDELSAVPEARREAPALPPSKTTTLAVPSPKLPEPELDPSPSPKQLAGEDPRLPLIVCQMYRHEPVVGIYLMCVRPSGAVASVTAVAGIPYDEEIKKTLRTWRYAPRAAPVCVLREFRFEVTGSPG